MSGKRLSKSIIGKLKHEEAIQNSIANREDKPKKMTIYNCPCGCGGYVWNQDDKQKVNAGLPLRRTVAQG